MCACLWYVKQFLFAILKQTQQETLEITRMNGDPDAA